MNLEDLTVDVEQHAEVNAAPADVFRALLYRLGEGNTAPNGQPLDMKLEPWPGGRWYRDRGNGIGHLWGHVQTIKPPSLIELTGSLFMSYPVMNHVEIRLEQSAGGTTVRLRHRALGFLEKGHRESFANGWKHLMDVLAKDLAEPARAAGA